MSKSARAPLQFDTPLPAPLPRVKAGAANDATDRQQVGARVKTSTYRQLKARAALDGVKVQDLVEQAIDAFLKA